MKENELKELCTDKEYPVADEIRKLDYACWRIADLLFMDISSTSFYDDISSNMAISIIGYLDLRSQDIICDFYKFDPYKKIYVRDCITKYLYESYSRSSKEFTIEKVEKCKEIISGFLKDLFKYGYRDEMFSDYSTEDGMVISESEYKRREKDIEDACNKDWYAKI